MKSRKGLKALLLATILALVATLALAQAEPIRDLGDGYLEKRRGEAVLVHFPDSCFESERAFKPCIDKALVKVLSCNEFANCKPNVELTSGDKRMIVTTKHLGVLEISGMRQGQGDDSLVGISIYRYEKETKEGVQADD